MLLFSYYMILVCYYLNWISYDFYLINNYFCVLDYDIDYLSIFNY